MNRLKLLLAATLGASPLSLFAQNVPPAVTHQIADVTEYAGAAALSIDVANAFTDPDVNDAVRFSTVLGDIDIALFGQQTPITVTNFLKYVDQGRYFVPGASSFVHRSIPGFIIQGGFWLGTSNNQNGAIQPTQVIPFSADSKRSRASRTNEGRLQWPKPGATRTARRASGSSIWRTTVVPLTISIFGLAVGIMRPGPTPFSEES